VELELVELELELVDPAEQTERWALPPTGEGPYALLGMADTLILRGQEPIFPRIGPDSCKPP
ncbi:MAG TPA: hypothetical protein VNI55_12600, partial [Gaiellaceae bacterium]|nr:hypothetical protein [Gaiellaceae bacterium]